MLEDRSLEVNVDLDRSVDRDEFYDATEYKGISTARWERIKEEVDFCDVVEELSGQRALRHSFIRCPFHGRDTSPSFHIYHNNAYCFGCAKYYDSIRFVAEHFQCSRPKALRWLEDKYKLPAMADVEIEEETDRGERKLTIKDLTPRFISLAITEIRKTEDPEIAEDYLRDYFSALAFDSPMPLARVLGPEELRKIAEKTVADE